jgi:hypothetical protein
MIYRNNEKKRGGWRRILALKDEGVRYKFIG